MTTTTKESIKEPVSDWSVHRINFTLLDLITDIFNDHLKKYKKYNMELLGECIFDEFGTKEITIVGGNNGKSDWSDYFKKLHKFIKDIEDDEWIEKVWLIELNTDPLDDKWYAKFGVRVTEKEYEGKILLDTKDIFNELALRYKEYYERFQKNYDENPLDPYLHCVIKGIESYLDYKRMAKQIEFQETPDAFNYFNYH